MFAAREFTTYCIGSGIGIHQRRNGAVRSTEYVSHRGKSDQ